MAPTYRTALTESQSPEVASRRSYNTGLCACVLLGVLELAGVLFVEALRKAIPRAAMLSAIAGVSLTFIAMGFAVEIFAAPGTAIVSMLMMLLFYAGQVKLPFKVPGGIVAVFIGWVLAHVSGELGYHWFMPAEVPAEPPSELPRVSTPAFVLPSVQHHFSARSSSLLLAVPSVVIPMWLITLVNNLANIEAASAVGDDYFRGNVSGCALMDICCRCSQPLPHACTLPSVFKAMGCRVGYLYLNVVPTVFFGCMVEPTCSCASSPSSPASASSCGSACRSLPAGLRAISP